MFLGSTNGAANDLEDVGRSPTPAIFEADGDANHLRGAEFPGGLGGNLSDQTAIGEAARSNLYGFEQAREGTARADCFAQISVREHDRLSIGKICCDHSHGNLEVFEAS